MLSGCEAGLPVHELFQLTPPKLELHGSPLHSRDDSVSRWEVFVRVLLSRGSWRAGKYSPNPVHIYSTSLDESCNKRIKYDSYLLTSQLLHDDDDVCVLGSTYP